MTSSITCAKRVVSEWKAVRRRADLERAASAHHAPLRLGSFGITSLP